MKTVVIIDYGSGNLHSAAKAFERAVKDNKLDFTVIVSDQPDDVKNAHHIVLPGVGAFGDCAAGLHAVPGMVETLTRAVCEDKRPFMGVCVGMQLLADTGHEYGAHAGLGWIAGEVGKLELTKNTLKIPHMGWNDLHINAATHPVLKNIKSGDHAYFVHSYHYKPVGVQHILASVDYDGPVCAVIGRDNLVGTQFHPEKSQKTGLQLITNFLNWTP